MTLPELMQLAQTLPAACTESPFGPESVCVRIGPHGRIFASFMPMPGWVSFKCEPNQGMDWRQQYPGTVRRGWHCPPVQQPYNNTLTMDGTVPDEVLRQMLFHSYDCALDSLSRAGREELLGSLRPYTTEDEPYILRWIPDEETYWRWSAGSVGQWPLAPGMFNDRMAQFPNGHPLIWLWQGQPAGFVVAFPQKDRERGIRFGYVVTDPALRGQGLGKRMMACAVHHARKKLKARSMHLSVYQNNPAAVRCYEANGFLRDEKVPLRVDTCMGQEWPCQAMIR